MLSVDFLSVTVLAPGRIGPFVATPVSIAVETDTVGCRVELRDIGWDACLVAAAFARMRSY